MGDDAAGAGRDGEPGQQADNGSRPPRRDQLARHHQNAERGPCHDRGKRNIDGGEEQAAIEVSGQKTQRDGGQTGPAADGQTPDRQERCHARKPDEERQDMPDDDRVGDVERLDIGRKHLKPRPVIPKREFYGFEVGAILEPARIPGERLWTVIVSIELVDRHRIVGRRRNPQHEHRAQQSRSRDGLSIECRALCCLVDKTRQRRSASLPSVGRPTNVQVADWCHRPRESGRRDPFVTAERCSAAAPFVSSVRVEATMLEKSDNAAEPAPTVPELDESIFSLDPEGGITTRMRRRLLLRRFWQSAAGFWRGRSARRTWLLSAAILALILANLAASYAMNVWNREIFNGLEQRDAGRVLTLSLIYFPLGVCLVMGQTYARMT